MTLADVVALLGSPTETTGSGMCYIHWRTPSGGRFTVDAEGLRRTSAINGVLTNTLQQP